MAEIDDINLDRIGRNMGRIIDKGGQDPDIQEYLQSEGVDPQRWGAELAPRLRAIRTKPPAPLPDVSNLRPRNAPPPGPNDPPQQSFPPDTADAPQQSRPMLTIDVNAPPRASQSPIPTPPAMNPIVDSTQIPELRKPGVPMGDDPKIRYVTVDGKKLTLRHIDGDKYEVVDAATPLPDAPQKQTALGRIGDAALQGIQRAMPDATITTDPILAAQKVIADPKAALSAKNLSDAGQALIGAVAAPFNALGPAVGQIATELGQDKTWSNKLSKDIDAAIAVTAIPGTTGFSAARAWTKDVPRGLSPTKLQQSVADFNATGVRPGIGDLTGSKTLQTVDNISAKLPGGGIARGRAQQNLDALAGKVDDTVKNLSKAELNPEIVGQSVTQGIGDWRDRFKAVGAKKFDQVGIPNAAEVAPAKLAGTLDDLTKVAADAENLSKSLVNKKILQIADDFRKDTASGIDGVLKTLPFDTVKRLRTQVGDLLTGNELIAEAPRAALKRVYAALSEDMRATAVAAGRGKQFDSANAFWKAGMDRVEKSLQPLVNKGAPEKITTYMQNMATTAPSELRNIVKSLSATQRNDVAALTLREMGKRAAQTSEDTFSIASWLTDWNKMPAQSKKILFGSTPGVMDSLNTIARVTDRLKSGTRVAANPSGTAQAATHSSAMMAGALGLATGNTPLLMGALGVYGAGVGTQLASRAASAITRGVVASKEASGKLVGNAAFLKWLADAVKAPSRSLSGSLHRLAVLAANMSPDERAPVDEYARALKLRAKGETVIDDRRR